jgi:predicted nucleotidyltransferase
MVNEGISDEPIKETIVQNVHPEKVILFGSYANGNPNDDSDLDLLVIKDMPPKKVQRGARFGNI